MAVCSRYTFAPRRGPNTHFAAWRDLPLGWATDTLRQLQREVNILSAAHGCVVFHLPGGKRSSQCLIKGLCCPDMSSTCFFNAREAAKCKPLKAAHFAASRA